MIAVALKYSIDVPKLRIFRIFLQSRLKPDQIFIIVNTEHEAIAQEIIRVDHSNFEYFISIVLSNVSLIVSSVW